MIRSPRMCSVEVTGHVLGRAFPAPELIRLNDDTGVKRVGRCDCEESGTAQQTCGY